MDKSTIAQLRKLQSVTKLPYLLIDDSGEELQAQPQEFSSQYKKEFLNRLIRDLAQSKRPKGILLFQLVELYYCSLIQLEKNLYLVTAPVCTSSIGNSITFASCTPYIHPRKIPELKKLMVYSPVLSLLQLEELTSLYGRLYGKAETDKGTVIHNASEISNETETGNRKATSEMILSKSVIDELESQRYNSLYIQERMSKAVAEGDYETFLNVQAGSSTDISGLMSLNPLRQAKYRFICALYGTSRSAIDGGLSSEYSMQLSDMYCQKMDSLDSIEEVNKLLVKVIREYCEKVRINKQSVHYCRYTKTVLEYIRTHLYESISLEELSEIAKLNRKSLSQYFNKDTGMKIPEYITMKRIEEAKSLLKSTDISLLEISELLCFSSQSYFIKKFKGFAGMTPLQYRESHIN